MLVPSSTDGIAAIVKKFVPSDSFDSLKRTFCAVATDLVSASEVMLTDGSLSQSVAASCAVPQFFKPVVREDMHLVDGGLLNNIPADICRVLGADYVVMCDVNPTRGEGTKELSSIAVVKATVSIMMANSSYKGYINSDVIIAPDTQGFKSTSKKGFEQMFERGYEAGKAAIKQIVDELYR
jgi:NTE family protein